MKKKEEMKQLPKKKGSKNQKKLKPDGDITQLNTAIEKFKTYRSHFLTGTLPYQSISQYVFTPLYKVRENIEKNEYDENSKPCGQALKYAQKAFTKLFRNFQDADQDQKEEIQKEIQDLKDGIIALREFCKTLTKPPKVEELDLENPLKEVDPQLSMALDEMETCRSCFKSASSTYHTIHNEILCRLRQIKTNIAKNKCDKNPGLCTQALKYAQDTLGKWFKDKNGAHEKAILALNGKTKKRGIKRMKRQFRL